MRIQFWGATDDVTGSMTFVKLSKGTLAVDAGMYQGSDEVEEKNLLLPPVAPEELMSVLLTHAHLDHCGLLPRLVSLGFRGKIYCTQPTAALVSIILKDSANLVDENFYTGEDVKETLNRIEIVEWNKRFTLLDAEICFYPAGHILGASSVMIKTEGKKILFSGDLGRKNDPLIPSPPPAPQADLVIMESTYGAKVRTGSYEKDLHQFLVSVARGSKVGLIASFAAARGQSLITLIHEFYQRHPEEKVRVVIDSPMMKEANRVYKKYSYLTKIPEKLYEALDEIEVLNFENEWKSLKKKQGPLIVISSSGMLTGGRIKRHLTNWQDEPKAILFLPGYQSEGTLGRDLSEGKGQALWKGEVWHSEAFSSHADQSELMQWVSATNLGSKIFLLHGEKEGKKILKERLQESGARDVFIPSKGLEVEV